VRRVLCGIVVTLVLAPAASAHVQDPLQLSLEWPARGTLTTPFGFTEGRYHPGLDIGILRSLTVRAASPGRVRLVGTPSGFEGYGSIVLVDAIRPFEMLYAHLASTGVRAGQWVVSGQPLGVAGCTGWCTGTHLHFELRRRGQAIDPRPLLP
jgi:murein DD-endopeptidase MepM/ murein hydrolase activator NlpD